MPTYHELQKKTASEVFSILRNNYPIHESSKPDMTSADDVISTLDDKLNEDDAELVARRKEVDYLTTKMQPLKLLPRVVEMMLHDGSLSVLTAEEFTLIDFCINATKDKQ